MKSQQILFLISVFCFLSSCSSNPDIVPAQANDFCASIHNTDAATLSNELKPLDSLMQVKSGAFVFEDVDNALLTCA